MVRAVVATLLLAVCVSAESSSTSTTISSIEHALGQAVRALRWWGRRDDGRKGSRRHANAQQDPNATAPVPSPEPASAPASAPLPDTPNPFSDTPAAPSNVSEEDAPYWEDVKDQRLAMPPPDPNSE
eukprot:Hpha_TRINITY_DN15078_c8_g3::TRINITY_DN15078_c8_g3_i1::g.123702::m.123702